MPGDFAPSEHSWVGPRSRRTDARIGEAERTEADDVDLTLALGVQAGNATRWRVTGPGIDERWHLDERGLSIVRGDHRRFLLVPGDRPGGPSAMQGEPDGEVPPLPYRRSLTPAPAHGEGCIEVLLESDAVPGPESVAALNVDSATERWILCPGVGEVSREHTTRFPAGSYTLTIAVEQNP